jgi:GTP-binding protein
VGTIVRDQRIGSVIKDFTADGETAVVARGGGGGRGNARFASSTNRAPTFAETGEAGQQRWLELELKILADVGIIGLPNAGKSTLLSRITEARPRIAEYPFTTLEVGLGVAESPEYSLILVADIPGLIEGAHSGRGLGYEFLRHIERALLLVHMVDMAPKGSNFPLDDYKTVRREMELYNPVLLEKPEIVVCNKMDLEGARENLAAFTEAVSAPIFPISALTGEGVEELMKEVVARLEKIKQPSPLC